MPRADADVSLSTLENDVGGADIQISTVEDEVRLRQQGLTEDIAKRVFDLLKISVIATNALTGVLAAVDAVFIANDVIEPEQRLVNEAILMSVLGATLVQVGAASIAIVYSLFKNAQNGGREPDA